jgi:membrane peptidoglycan carboxypeptidase
MNRIGALRPRRTVLFGFALLFLVCVAVLGASWVTDPPVGDLHAQVAANAAQRGERPVELSAVATVMLEAAVASEDERFYHHHGIDSISVARKLALDVAEPGWREGATITEQLAKHLYLHGGPGNPWHDSLWHKLQMMTLALKIERRYTKQQILYAYLNTVYFGQGARGIWDASHRFFGVSPASLDLGQASLLAGLITGPYANDPYSNPAGARRRQVHVLDSMVRNRFVSEQVAEGVLAKPLRLRGGDVLAPVLGVRLGHDPLVSKDVFVAGVAALGLGIVAAFVWRGAGNRAIRYAARAATAPGVMLLIRSVRVV